MFVFDATFKHPLYSFMGDWMMFWQMLTGEIAFSVTWVVAVATVALEATPDLVDLAGACAGSFRA